MADLSQDQKLVKPTTCFECAENKELVNHPHYSDEYCCADCFEELGGEEKATSWIYKGEHQPGTH